MDNKATSTTDFDLNAIKAGLQELERKLSELRRHL